MPENIPAPADIPASEMNPQNPSEPEPSSSEPSSSEPSSTEPITISRTAKKKPRSTQSDEEPDIGKTSAPHEPDAPNFSYKLRDAPIEPGPIAAPTHIGKSTPKATIRRNIETAAYKASDFSFTTSDILVLNEREKELKAYQEKLSSYNTNLADELTSRAEHQEDLTTYQNALSTYFEDRETERQARLDHILTLENHAEQLTIHNEKVAQEERDRAAHQMSLDNYQTAFTEYTNFVEQERVDQADHRASLARYQESLSMFNDAVDTENEARAAHQERLDTHREQLDLFESNTETERLARIAHRERLDTHRDQLALFNENTQTEQAARDAHQLSLSNYQEDLALYNRNNAQEMMDREAHQESLTAYRTSLDMFNENNRQEQADRAAHQVKLDAFQVELNTYNMNVAAQEALRTQHQADLAERETALNLHNERLEAFDASIEVYDRQVAEFKEANRQNIINSEQGIRHSRTLQLASREAEDLIRWGAGSTHTLEQATRFGELTNLIDTRQSATGLLEQEQTSLQSLGETLTAQQLARRNTLTTLIPERKAATGLLESQVSDLFSSNTPSSNPLANYGENTYDRYKTDVERARVISHLVGTLAVSFIERHNLNVELTRIRIRVGSYHDSLRSNLSPSDSASALVGRQRINVYFTSGTLNRRVFFYNYLQGVTSHLGQSPEVKQTISNLNSQITSRKSATTLLESESSTLVNRKTQAQAERLGTLPTLISSRKEATSIFQTEHTGLSNITFEAGLYRYVSANINIGNTNPDVGYSRSVAGFGDELVSFHHTTHRDSSGRAYTIRHLRLRHKIRPDAFGELKKSRILENTQHNSLIETIDTNRADLMAKETARTEAREADLQARIDVVATPLSNQNFDARAFRDAGAWNAQNSSRPQRSWRDHLGVRHTVGQLSQGRIKVINSGIRSREREISVHAQKLRWAHTSADRAPLSGNWYRDWRRQSTNQNSRSIQSYYNAEVDRQASQKTRNRQLAINRSHGQVQAFNAQFYGTDADRGRLANLQATVVKTPEILSQINVLRNSYAVGRYALLKEENNALAKRDAREINKLFGTEIPQVVPGRPNELDQLPKARIFEIRNAGVTYTFNHLIYDGDAPLQIHTPSGLTEVHARPQPILTRAPRIFTAPDAVAHRPDQTIIQPDAIVHRPDVAFGTAPDAVADRVEQTFTQPDAVADRVEQTFTAPDAVAAREELTFVTPDPVAARQEKTFAALADIAARKEQTFTQPDAVAHREDKVLTAPKLNTVTSISTFLNKYKSNKAVPRAVIEGYLLENNQKITGDLSQHEQSFFKDKSKAPKSIEELLDETTSKHGVSIFNKLTNKKLADKVLLIKKATALSLDKSSKNAPSSSQKETGTLSKLERMAEKDKVEKALQSATIQLQQKNDQTFIEKFRAPVLEDYHRLVKEGKIAGVSATATLQESSEHLFANLKQATPTYKSITNHQGFQSRLVTRFKEQQYYANLRMLGGLENKIRANDLSNPFLKLQKSVDKDQSKAESLGFTYTQDAKELLHYGVILSEDQREQNQQLARGSLTLNVLEDFRNQFSGTTDPSETILFGVLEDRGIDISKQATISIIEDGKQIEKTIKVSELASTFGESNFHAQKRIDFRQTQGPAYTKQDIDEIHKRDNANRSIKILEDFKNQYKGTTDPSNTILKGVLEDKGLDLNSQGLFTFVENGKEKEKLIKVSEFTTLFGKSNFHAQKRIDFKEVKFIGPLKPSETKIVDKKTGEFYDFKTGESDFIDSNSNLYKLLYKDPITNRIGDLADFKNQPTTIFHETKRITPLVNTGTSSVVEKPIDNSQSRLPFFVGGTGNLQNDLFKLKNMQKYAELTGSPEGFINVASKEVDTFLKNPGNSIFKASAEYEKGKQRANFIYPRLFWNLGTGDTTPVKDEALSEITQADIFSHASPYIQSAANAFGFQLDLPTPKADVLARSTDQFFRRPFAENIGDASQATIIEAGAWIAGGKALKVGVGGLKTLTTATRLSATVLDASIQSGKIFKTSRTVRGLNTAQLSVKVSRPLNTLNVAKLSIQSSRIGKRFETAKLLIQTSKPVSILNVAKNSAQNSRLGQTLGDLKLPGTNRNPRQVRALTKDLKKIDNTEPLVEKIGKNKYLISRGFEGDAIETPFIVVKTGLRNSYEKLYSYVDPKDAIRPSKVLTDIKPENALRLKIKELEKGDGVIDAIRKKPYNLSKVTSVFKGKKSSPKPKEKAVTENPPFIQTQAERNLAIRLAKKTGKKSGKKNADESEKIGLFKSLSNKFKSTTSKKSLTNLNLGVKITKTKSTPKAVPKPEPKYSRAREIDKIKKTKEPKLTKDLDYSINKKPGYFEVDVKKASDLAKFDNTGFSLFNDLAKVTKVNLKAGLKDTKATLKKAETITERKPDTIAKTLDIVKPVTDNPLVKSPSGISKSPAKSARNIADELTNEIPDPIKNSLSSQYSPKPIKSAIDNISKGPVKTARNIADEAKDGLPDPIKNSLDSKHLPKPGGESKSILSKSPPKPVDILETSLIKASKYGPIKSNTYAFDEAVTKFYGTRPKDTLFKQGSKASKGDTPNKPSTPPSSDSSKGSKLVEPIVKGSTPRDTLKHTILDLESGVAKDVVVSASKSNVLNAASSAGLDVATKVSSPHIADKSVDKSVIIEQSAPSILKPVTIPKLKTESIPTLETISKLKNPQSIKSSQKAKIDSGLKQDTANKLSFDSGLKQGETSKLQSAQSLGSALSPAPALKSPPTLLAQKNKLDIGQALIPSLAQAQPQQQKQSAVLKLKFVTPTKIQPIIPKEPIKVTTRPLISPFILNEKEEKRLRRLKKESKRTDFLGNVPLDSIIGQYKRQELTYGDKKTAKLLQEDKKKSRHYKKSKVETSLTNNKVHKSTKLKNSPTSHVTSRKPKSDKPKKKKDKNSIDLFSSNNSKFNL